MFLGHFAVGLATKKATPATSLGTLFMACQLMDLLWPVLVLLGIEVVTVDPQATAVTPLNFESYPFSHSLVASIFLSVSLAISYFFFSKNKKGSFVLAGVVFSHWVLDWITHRPDLPLLSDQSTKLGLGLWNSVTGTVLVEASLYTVGVYIYWRNFKPVHKSQRIGFISLIVFMSLIYIANIWGPKPELGMPAAAIAGPALAMWLFVAWAAWIDHKKPKI